MVDHNTLISWETVHKISHSWVDMLIFYVFFFGGGGGSCMWSDAISRWIHQSNSIKFCANLKKSSMETLGMIRQACMSMSHTRVFELHALLRANRTSIEGDQLTGRPISSTTPDTMARLINRYNKTFFHNYV
jgi:hypothetical protein